MNPGRVLVVVAGCGSAYLAMYWLNEQLFPAASFTEGVDWIFMPSGVRLACVLVFLHWGALGVALGTLAITWQLQEGLSPMTACVTAAISGFAPWLARWLYLRATGIGPDLAHLSSASLLQMAALFAVITAGMHQLWYGLRGLTQDVLQNMVVMAIGDFLGCLIVLYAVKFGFAALSALQADR